MFATARSEPDSGTAGFTLIEVLVALAVLAVSMMSIGSLVAVNMRGSRALEQHLALLSVARAVAAGLPNAAASDGGRLTGETDGRRWQADIRPFTGNLAVRPASPWLPQSVVITVRAPSGASFRLDTVRLRPRPQS